MKHLSGKDADDERGSARHLPVKITADTAFDCLRCGAGTGSVSVEMAMQAVEGRVYAIEKKPEAVELLYKNKEKFAADNLEIVEGLAPEACVDLPVPTHAFYRRLLR